MRVIAGSARGRRLRAPAGADIRPTSDKVRGAIFNLLSARFPWEGRRLLDLFAGTGALGIEALSRGAAVVTFVDTSSQALDLVRANLEACGFADQARVVRSKVPAFLRRLAEQGDTVDGVFLDPPYGEGLVAATLTSLAQAAILTPEAWVVVEHAADEALPDDLGHLELTRSWLYGKSAVSLLQPS